MGLDDFAFLLLQCFGTDGQGACCFLLRRPLGKRRTGYVGIILHLHGKPGTGWACMHRKVTGARLLSPDLGATALGGHSLVD